MDLNSIIEFWTMAQIPQNIFDDCFDEKGDGNLHPNTYEVILAQSVDLRNSKLEELRMHRDQVRDDSEAIQQVEKVSKSHSR